MVLWEAFQKARECENINRIGSNITHGSVEASGEIFYFAVSEAKKLSDEEIILCIAKGILP